MGLGLVRSVDAGGGGGREPTQAPCGSDLIARWDSPRELWARRRAAGVDPHFRAVAERDGVDCQVMTGDGEILRGLDFAGSDMLSLGSHPALRAKAIEAVQRWGLAAGGSLAAQGGSMPHLRLADEMADFLCCREVVLLPSAGAAATAVIRATVAEGDHVVLDALAHDCLRTAAAAVTPRLHSVRHCSAESLAERLGAIRRADAQAGILVVTQSLFALDSEAPDLCRLRRACQDWGATLLIWVGEDLGGLGDGGLGFAGEQGLIGEADLLVGSFSGCFAAMGGFVASKSPGLLSAMRGVPGPLHDSAAMSPVQASVALAALGVICSREGAQRRARLRDNVHRLRQALAARAFPVLGKPSPIVPVWLGEADPARAMTSDALRRGVFVTLVEQPLVARSESRWLLRMTTAHSEAQIARLVEALAEAREAAAGSCDSEGMGGGV